MRTHFAAPTPPYADAAPPSVKPLKDGTLRTYEGLLHGRCATHDIINPDVLAFIQG